MHLLLYPKKRVPEAHAANSQAARPVHMEMLKKRNNIRVPPVFIIIALITFHLLSNFSPRFHFWPVLSDSLSQAFPSCSTYFGELSVSLIPH